MGGAGIRAPGDANGLTFGGFAPYGWQTFHLNGRMIHGQDLEPITRWKLKLMAQRSGPKSSRKPAKKRAVPKPQDESTVDGVKPRAQPPRAGAGASTAGGNGSKSARGVTRPTKAAAKTAKAAAKTAKTAKTGAKAAKRAAKNAAKSSAKPAAKGAKRAPKAAKGAARTSTKTAAGTPLREKLRLSEENAGMLKKECEQLRAQLELARNELVETRKEITDLQHKQEFVLNRIDWAIDSLHTILEDDP